MNTDLKDNLMFEEVEANELNGDGWFIAGTLVGIGIGVGVALT